MLEQLNRVTTSGGEAIRTLRPTLRSLFEGYEQEPDADQRAEMLMDAIVSLILHSHKEQCLYGP